MFILTLCNASSKALDASNKSWVALGFKEILDLFDQLSRKLWFQRAVCDHKYAVGRDRSSWVFMIKCVYLLSHNRFCLL